MVLSAKRNDVSSVDATCMGGIGVSVAAFSDDVIAFRLF